jgi:DNA-binding MarR family transcriptional regulator
MGLGMAFRLEEDLGFLLARTHRAMRRWLMARLEPLDITYEQFKVLNALCEDDNVPQVTLADRLNTDKTSLARMLRRMERAGLIFRTADDADARVNRVCLTARGRELQTKVVPHRDEGLTQATDGLNEEEVQELNRMLDIVYHNMSY